MTNATIETNDLTGAALAVLVGGAGRDRGEKMSARLGGQASRTVTTCWRETTSVRVATPGTHVERQLRRNRRERRW